MIETLIYISGLVLVVAIGLGLIRMWRGPSILDRLLSFDLITTATVAMMGILSIFWQTDVFLELILIFTMLGFFGVVVFVFYLDQRLEDFSQIDEKEPKLPENNTNEGGEG
ncbi:MAG: monovalent cation/H+ antiporter complex subunit F [Puniceicoccaceae bacterium]